MLQFPLQELMDKHRCYEYLLKVLHREGRRFRRDIRCLRSNNYTITIVRRLLPIAVESAGWSLISSRALCGAALATAAVKSYCSSGESPQVCPTYHLAQELGLDRSRLLERRQEIQQLMAQRFSPPRSYPTPWPKPRRCTKSWESGVASVGGTTSGGGVCSVL